MLDRKQSSCGNVDILSKRLNLGCEQRASQIRREKFLWEGIRFYHGSTTWDYRLRDWPASRLAEVLFSHQYTYPYKFLRLSSLFKSVVSDVSNEKDYSITCVTFCSEFQPRGLGRNETSRLLTTGHWHFPGPWKLLPFYTVFGARSFHVSQKPPPPSPSNGFFFPLPRRPLPFFVPSPFFFHHPLSSHYTTGNNTKLRSFSSQYGWTTPFRRHHRPGGIGAFQNHRKDGTNGR